VRRAVRARRRFAACDAAYVLVGRFYRAQDNARDHAHVEKALPR
jgi:hypothetical protein